MNLKCKYCLQFQCIDLRTRSQKNEKKKSKENKIKNYAAYFIHLCSKVSGLKRNSDNCHKNIYVHIHVH